MKFSFSPNAPEKEKRQQRFFEILPGLTSWTILISLCLLSFAKPIWAAIFIIAFDLYWLLRLFYMTLFLVISYIRLSIEENTDWMARVRGLDKLSDYLKRMDHKPSTLKETLSLHIHKKEVRQLLASSSLPPSSDDIYHLVLIPVIKEGADIVESGLESILKQAFPTKRILILLALEQRANDDVKKGVNDLAKKYHNRFLDLRVVEHPDGLVGEKRVKGANVTYAARQAAETFQSNHIPFENVIVSCFDSDTVVSPHYFSCLTYHFMVFPFRTRASFQPIPVYHNNIWEAPGFSRVLEMGSSFFQLVEATNREKLVTFSSHSMSFKALVEVGYWPVDMISDDSAIFWKAYIHYDGDYHVVPMYVTVSMDMVLAKTRWETAQNCYKQKRRWAWGVENFPIVMRAFLQSDKISLYNKIRHAYKLFEGHVAWATWAFILTFIGWLPAYFATREFSNSVLYYSAPRITGTIFNLALSSLFTTIILSLCLLPKKKVKHSLLKRLGFACEWLLVPLIATFLSALPALETQTRMMLGKHMEFWVTDKKRAKKTVTA